MKNPFLTRANNRNETFFEKIKLENFLKCLRSNFQGFSDFLEEHDILLDFNIFLLKCTWNSHPKLCNIDKNM